MSNKTLTIAVVFRAIDQLLGPARRMLGAIKDVDRAAAQAKGLRVMGDDLASAGAAMQRFGAIGAGLGLGAAHALGLTALPGEAIESSHQLRTMGNVAQLSAEQIALVRVALRGVSAQTNQMRPELLQATATLTAAGWALSMAMKNLPVIAKTATAEVANINDVAKTSFVLIDNLKVKEGELAQALEALAQAGKEGRFELAAMAQYFPALTAGAAMLGMRGVPAVTSLGAALQIAMKGAGDSSSAANNLQNFLAKITAPETARNFKKLGVDLKQEFETGVQEGDVIAHMVRLVERITGGDQFKLGALFGDMQVQNFLKPMLANLGEYERIKTSAATARGGIDRDYVNMLGETKEQWTQLKIQMGNAVAPGLEKALSAVNSVLRVINAHPFLRTGMLWAIGGSIAVSVLIAALGTLIIVAGATVTNLGVLASGAAAFRVGWLGAAHSLQGGPLVLAKLAGAFRLLTASTWSWTAALLANPMTWVVAAIAAAIAGLVYVVYRYWGPITAFLSNMGARLYAAGANLVSMLWAGMKSVASKPVALVRSIVQRIRNFLPSSPAKEGPLRDLHRIRIMETIASTMRPGPMVRAMRLATAGTMVAALSSNAMYQAPTRSATAGAPNVTLQLAPQIHITTSGAVAPDQIRAQVHAAMRSYVPELKRELERLFQQMQRGEFNDRRRGG